MADITVMGAGSWGTAMAVLFADSGHKVTLWAYLDSEVEALTRDRENEKLPGAKIPDTIEITSDMGKALSRTDICIMAVPSNAVRSAASSMKPYVDGSFKIVNAAKGIDEKTLMRLSQVVEEELSGTPVSVISGPSHAEEVVNFIPTAIVIGSHTKEDAQYLQHNLMSRTFRVYISPDMTGIEIGAALKNVVALAAGIADGLGCGDNTKAALITRGMAEISRLGMAMGGKAETFSGLTGMGDLIVTCGSMHSRNRRAGILIGQGHEPAEAVKSIGQVVEGVNCAKAALRLSEKYSVEMPIVQKTNEILFSGLSPREAMDSLMLRDPKIENPLIPFDR
ncbi:MAG: NAD(P)-dependent glycerol-3-phosphate dehydrogenase [Lachnospiraceae bacterium]|nr:NAD(P)-dependent glycerol-3-phosphate dehydrogenase [Lachnospiraceae bacterium]